MPSPIIVAEALISHFEGCSLTPYKCPAGVWTIGYGNTHLADGSNVTATTPPLSSEEADSLLNLITIRTIKSIKNYLRVLVNNNQLAAVTSLVYNIGIGNFSTSTLLKRLNEGSFREAADEFSEWTFSGGKRLPGLIVRREDERSVFLGVYPDWLKKNLV